MSDQQLEAFVEANVDHGIVLLDADGVVTRWSTGAERITGYPARVMVGSDVSVLYPDDATADGRPEADLAIAVADGRHEDVGWRRRADGSPFWASAVTTALRDERGRLSGFGQILQDLTDQKRGEDELRASEERFRLLVSGVADYAIFLLDRDGTVASWNLGAERLKGYTAGEIIGRHFSTFYTDEDRRRHLPDHGLHEALTTGRWEQEGWRLRKDGSRFWANVVITRLSGPTGEHWGFAKVTRDLTDRKRNEDALRGILQRERDTADRLREVDRMRSDLIATITHDLRGPVGVLRDLIELYRKEQAGSATEDQSDLLDRMAGKADLLTSLVDDVFEMSLLGSGHVRFELAPLDLGALLDQLVADLTTTTGRDIRRSGDRAVDVDGDAHRLWQVFGNLLSNALKYSPTDAAITVDAASSGDVVRVVVADGGPGIPPEHVETVFEPFRRLGTTSGTPGSGLGLHIARLLVDGRGGRIWAASPASGAEFVVELPCSARARG